MSKPRVSELRGTVAISGLKEERPFRQPQQLPAAKTLLINDVTDALRLVTTDQGDKLTEDQIMRLEQIRLSDGEKFLVLDTSENRDVFYLVVGDLNRYGFDRVYDSLRDRVYDSRSEYVFEVSPGFESSRLKSMIDSEIYRNKIEAVAGALTCPRCKGRETISMEKQLRRADEPATVFITCVNCEFTWKE